MFIHRVQEPPFPEPKEFIKDDSKKGTSPAHLCMLSSYEYISFAIACTVIRLFDRFLTSATCTLCARTTGKAEELGLIPKDYSMNTFQVVKRKETVLGQQNAGEGESDHYCRIGHIYWTMGGK